MVELLQKISSFFVCRIICSCMLLCAAGLQAQPDWVWAKDAHTNSAEYATDVAVDPVSGNVVTVGKYGSSLASFYGSSFTGSTKGGFVAKYDPSGNVIWGFKIGNNHNNICNGVAIDSSGNIYVTGSFETTTDFRGLSATATNLTATGNIDAFLAKYNSSGQLLWVKKGGGSAADEGFGVCLNSSSVFVTGYYTNSGTFGSFGTVANNSTQNVFVCAYNYSGSEMWLADAGATQPSYGNAVACDNACVYLTGEFKGATLSVFNSSGALSSALTNLSSSKTDAYVISYSATGALNWVKSISSTENEKGHSISVSGSMLYVTGSLEGSTTFPGYAANPVTYSGSNTDMYVAQLTKTSGITQWVRREGSSDQDEGLCIESDGFGNVYVGGFYKNSISFTGGPTLSAGGGNAEELFVVSYSSSGAYQWVRESGDNGKDEPYGIAANTLNEIYVCGEYKKNPPFGSSTLTDDGSPNIFVAKISCPALLNNTITSSQTVCRGTSPAMLIGSLPSGGTPAYTYSWEQSADNITWLAAAGTNNTKDYSAPAITNTTYYRRRVFSSAGCLNTILSNVITISVDQPPSVSVAGPPQTVCVLPGTTTLNANVPVTGTGLWTLVSGGGTISNATSATTGISSLPAGNNVFKWSISNGVCPASVSTVTISVDQLPTASSAGTDQAVCVSSPATLNANAPSSGTGVWSITSGSGTIVTPSSPASSASLAPGVNVLTWTIANGTCPSSTDAVVIAVDALPSSSAAGADQNICITSGTTLNGNSPAVGNGLWTLVSGSGTIATSTSPTSAFNGTIAGTAKLVWTISNGVCPSSTDTMNILVDALPSTSGAGADQVICASSPFTNLNAIIPVTGNGVWSLVSGSGSISSPFSANTSVNGLSAGNNIFSWIVTNGVCPSSGDSVNIVADLPPTVSSAGADQNICITSGTALNGNSPAVGNGLWTLVSGSGTIATSTSPGSAFNGTAAGTAKLVWTISNGVCPSSTDTMNILVDALPSVSGAGANQVICASSPFANLNAIIPVTGSGVWSLVSGSGSISSPSSASTSVNGLSAGNNIFSWTVTNGVCPSSGDSVNVVADLPPTISSAGADQNICITSGATLNGNSPAVGNGLWTLVSGSGTIATSTSPTSAFNGAAAGTTKLVWTISNGVCPSSADTMNILVDALPSASGAGADLEICASTPFANLNAIVPVTGNGVWSLVSGSGFISSPFSATSSVNGLSPGNNIFSWTVTNGVCPSSGDSVNVVADLPPSLSAAGADQVVCISAGAVPLSANFPVTGTGAWSLVSGSGTFSDSSSATASLALLSAGTSVVRWTISNGVCPVSTDTVMIRIDALPDVANAGADQTICISNPVATLTANTPLTGSGAWAVVSGIASVSLPFSATSLVSGLTAGATLFTWTITNGVCPSADDTVKVMTDQLPTSSIAGADQQICISSGAAPLAGNIPLTGTGGWSVISGSGIFSDPSAAISSLTSLSPGTSLLSWTISNGVCAASADTTAVVVDALPSAAVAGSDQHVCVSSSAATMNAGAPSVGTGLWTLLSGNGNIAAPSSPLTGITGFGPGVNTFQWTVTNNTCPASVSTVNIIVDALPDNSSAGPDQVTCESSSLLSLSANAPAVGTGQWSVVSGSGTFSDASSAVTNVNTGTPGINKFAWTITNGVCLSSADTMNIYVDALPSAADAGAGRTVCITAPSVALNGNVPAVGNVAWAVLSGSATISSPSAAATSVSGLSAGDNVFSYTISNGVCPSSVSSVTITADQVPDIAQAGPDMTTDIPFVELQANLPSTGTGTWSLIFGNGSLASATDPFTNITGLSVGANILRWEIRNGACPASSDDVLITMNPLHIPNGFSPNGDGINDTYSIEALKYYEHVKFNVFNRWGNEVYASDEYRNEWDGKNSQNEKLADDTYYFILEVMPGMQYSGFVIIKTK
jgi:gliding motility-associated-like protein